MARLVLMKLNEYIEMVGNEAAAKIFGVSVRRVVSWRLEYRFPRPEMALEIERMTHGKVTYKEIYGAKHAATSGV